MFPATSPGTPAASNIAPSSADVVVFPFVPVTPMIGFGSSRAPSSISEITSIAALPSGDDRLRAAGDAGALDDELDAVEHAVIPGPEVHIGGNACDVELALTVVGDDLGSLRGEGFDCGSARSRETDDEGSHGMIVRHAAKESGVEERRSG